RSLRQRLRSGGDAADARLIATSPKIEATTWFTSRPERTPAVGDLRDADRHCSRASSDIRRVSASRQTSLTFRRMLAVALGAFKTPGEHKERVMNLIRTKAAKASIVVLCALGSFAAAGPAGASFKRHAPTHATQHAKFRATNDAKYRAKYR